MYKKNTDKKHVTQRFDYERGMIEYRMNRLEHIRLPALERSQRYNKICLGLTMLALVLSMIL